MQVGTVSGRVTSDFQQFPKKGIVTYDGRELFTPRKLVKTPDGDYTGIVYIDYSQIELRIQAMYTILVGHPEPNLCGAYMPYNCKNNNGQQFDYYNPAHISTWNQDWYYADDPTKRWKPIDVHQASTCLMFNITPDDPKFKELRGDGKRYNFAKNYGASRRRVKEMYPDKSDEEIDRIDAAYYKAFPGVKYYHDYCYRLADAQSYAINLFGVRYYNVSGHNLINMFIQGSGAFLLKLKIREIYDYCKANNIKSRLQMNIHDELSWKKHKDEAAVFFEFKRIMETWTDTLVPLVAEMDLTRTVWADKKEVKGVEELVG
jgi:DNA polymerase-1